MKKFFTALIGAVALTLGLILGGFYLYYLIAYFHFIVSSPLLIFLMVYAGLAITALCFGMYSTVVQRNPYYSPDEDEK